MKSLDNSAFDTPTGITMQGDGLENLERLRLNLEISIEKLRKSLAYWQLWEAEYEGLKESLQTIDNDASPGDMLAVGVDMGGDIVNEKEVRDLIWQTKGVARTKSQIYSNIHGRIDTGQKNAATVRKQLHTAEDKLERVLFVSNPAAETEEGLPVMAITEELDDEDNVISSSVKRDDEDLPNMDKYMAMLNSGKGQNALPASSVPPKDEVSPPINIKSVTTPARETSKRPSSARKVSFAAEPEISVIPSRPSETPGHSAPIASSFNPTMKSNLHPTEHMIILDDNDNAIDSEPLEIVDTSKLASEARQNMDGIGAIVASMTIDGETDDEDDDYEQEESEDDEVDWKTLDRTPVGAELADDDYKNYIEGLMKKHEAAFENVGPRHDESILETLASAGSTVTPTQPNAPDAPSAVKRGKSSSGQKGVRFAEELDISPARTEPIIGAIASTITDLPVPAPFMDTILERDTRPKKPLVDAVVERSSSSKVSTSNTETTTQPKKVSRFKASRSGG